MCVYISIKFTVTFDLWNTEHDVIVDGRATWSELPAADWLMNDHKQILTSIPGLNEFMLDM